MADFIGGITLSFFTIRDCAGPLKASNTLFKTLILSDGATDKSWYDRIRGSGGAGFSEEGAGW